MARTFKIKSFIRDARKAGIDDVELCRISRKAQKGQYQADLGGGVLKSKLNNAEHRSFILVKGGTRYVFALLIAKADAANATPQQIKALQTLAEFYEAMDEKSLEAAIKNGSLKEICPDQEDQKDNG